MVECLLFLDKLNRGMWLQMASEDIKRVKRAIRKDERFARLKEIYETAPQYNLPLDEFRIEMDTTFASRKVRQLKTSTRDSGFAQNIIDALMEDQAIRGRFTEILTACIRCDRTLSASMEKMRAYLMIEYHGSIVRLYGTKIERERFIDYMMKTYEEYRKKVIILREQLELMITDIDKAGFAIKNSVEAIKLLSRPEAQI